MKYRRALAARPRGSPEPGDRVREGREAARRERGVGGGDRLAGEIRLSGTGFNELEGPRRDLAGHFSIGHGVDATPPPPPAPRFCAGGAAARWGSSRAGVSGAGLSEWLEEKDRKGMAETAAGG